MNERPPKTTPPFIDVPDWNEYPPSLQPLAKGIFVLLFPLIACLRVGATLWGGAMFLAMALSFLFVVVSTGPVAVLIVIVVTVIAARWTFQSRPESPSGHVRGRPVDRRTATPAEHSSVRGRSIVRRTVRSNPDEGRRS